MRQSHLFTKTSKETVADEPTANAQLLVKAGYVDKLMAGVFSFLPLGLRVINKIEDIVRKEMNKVGGQEVMMATLHPSENWKKTGGWDNIDVLFKLKSRTEREYALGQSEEEVVTPLVKPFVTSYKDLPVAVYQIHNKYRDELRSKSGLLRGREFRMKDMYSFHLDQEDFEKFYNIVKDSYLDIYSRCGLRAMATEASGGSFSEKISYEFMVLTDAGEDDILYCDTCGYCINTEITDLEEGGKCPKCSDNLKKARASEAGNVFDLNQKYTKDFGLVVADELGERQHPIMGCYGIGTSRLMGIIVEKFHDDKGIIWPKTVAPFQVHLVNLSNDATQTDVLYETLTKAGIDVLYDDRDKSAGAKLADADLIGIPIRLVVGNKTEGKVEWKFRDQADSELLEEGAIIDKINEYYDQ